MKREKFFDFEMERKITMAKKRTTDENILHEKAVKVRKMTDEQFVHYIEDRVETKRGL